MLLEEPADEHVQIVAVIKRVVRVLTEAQHERDDVEGPKAALVLDRLAELGHVGMDIDEASQSNAIYVQRKGTSGPEKASFDVPVDNAEEATSW